MSVREQEPDASVADLLAASLDEPSTSGREETAILFGTQLWNVLAALGVHSMLAWTLGPEGRGAYVVCVVFGALMGVVFTVGSDRGAQYFVISGRITLSQGVWVGVASALVGATLATGLGWMLIGSGVAFFEKADASSFRVALPIIPLSLLVTALQLQLAGLRRFGRLAWFAVAFTTSHLIGIGLLVGVLGLGVNGAVAAHWASLALVAALLLRDLRAHCGLVWTPIRWEQIAPVLGYGVRYYPGRIGTSVDLRLGIVLLGLLAARAEIGLFAATTALALRVLVISESLQSALMPRIASDPAGRAELVAQCARLSALFSGLCLLLIAALAVPLVWVILSPAFLPAVSLIWIAAPGIFLHAASRVFMAYFRGINRPGVCSLVIWVGIVVNGVGLLVLYPEIGLAGAAWAMTLGFAARSLVLVIAFTRTSGLSLRATWLPRRADAALVRSAGAEFYAKLWQARNGRAHG